MCFQFFVSSCVRQLLVCHGVLGIGFLSGQPQVGSPEPCWHAPPPNKKGDILFLAQLQAEQNASGCWLSVAGHLLLNLGDGHSNCMQYIFTGISDLMISNLANYGTATIQIIRIQAAVHNMCLHSFVHLKQKTFLTVFKQCDDNHESNVCVRLRHKRPRPNFFICPEV